MDEVTQQIRDMYTSYPYPKRDHTYIQNLLDTTDKDDKFFFSYARALELVTGNRTRHGLRVLNAGCGTGENFIFQAIMEPEIDFLLLDVTPSSVRKVQEYIDYFELDNVRVMEGDLMELDRFLGAEYDHCFDFIISTGVLHHLPSPETGLKSLKNKLKPDGIMYLMLYGRQGRSEINLMQHLLNTLEPDRAAFDERITIMKEVIEYLQGSNEQHRLKTSPSMVNYLATHNYKVEELVDAFLHINENAYEVKDIFEFLATADMKFISFYDEPTRAIPPGLPDKLQNRIRSLPDLQRYMVLENLDGYKRIQSFYCAHSNFEYDPPEFDEIINCKINTWPESGLVRDDKPDKSSNMFWRFLSSDTLEHNYRNYQVPLTPFAADIALLCKKSINFQQLTTKIKKKHKANNTDILSSLKYLHEHKVIYLVRK